MMQPTSRAADKLGDLVRKATKHKGPWPKISVWHGSADRTVNPGNADEIVKQWLDVHGLPSEPMSTGEVDGHPRAVWWNADGETVVESYTITDMAHGTPLGLSGTDEVYGAEGAFLIEAGISSSYHIANFFGLTERVTEAAKPVTKAAVTPSAATASLQSTDLAATLWSRANKPVRQPKPVPHEPKRRAIDVGGVITRALTAAGLMK
jgi:feruloyl esterase